MNPKVKLFFNHTPVEGNALEQLNKTVELEDMIKAVGMPDLHAGKGHPIGASFLTKNIIYPYLVGNDIGCGMNLSQLEIKTHKAKRDKIAKKLRSIEDELVEDISDLENKFRTSFNDFRHSLGTVGGGNHFVEIQGLESIENQELFQNAVFEKGNLFIMAHTGSRGLGESILLDHIQKFKNQGLTKDSEDFTSYMKQHDQAVLWAKANRELLVKKASQALGCEYKVFIDIVHNWVEQTSQGFIHRKGTAPANQGLIVIPGSRGDFSYLVSPIQNEDNLDSLAHGAGRKWKRGESRDRLSEKYSVEDLQITDLKSQVICEDKDLLYEEAPQNYKKITKVIQDLVDFKLIEVVAILKPIVTYKKKID
jgi:release factor H-coupled RctB family protein